MKRLKTELNALVNRGVDRHLRLAVTGLSRSGKTAFITALVNQLLNIHTGARLPLLSAAREERLLGVKRVPQRDFGIPRFTYDEGLAQLYGQPPMWPTPTRGVSEIRLALRYRSNDSLLRHFKDTSTLYLEIVDYPGEWLLDLPMLAQDYLSWSRQMTGLLQGQRAEWSARWRQLCAGLDPLAPADEARLADIAAAWTDYLHACKREGLHFIQPGRFVLPGEMAGAPALQFFPWPDVDAVGEAKLAQADKHSNAGMLRDRVLSLRNANIFEDHVYRHATSGLVITAVEEGVVHTQSSYIVVITGQAGDSSVYQAGTYLDEVVQHEGEWRYRSKRVVYDTLRVATLLATPI